MRKLNAARKLSLKMLQYFAIVARLVVEHGGEVSFEWPRNCEGWAQQALINLIAELGLTPAACDGCMLGFHSKINGEPIKKAMADRLYP